MRPQKRTKVSLATVSKPKIEDAVVYVEMLAIKTSSSRFAATSTKIQLNDTPPFSFLSNLREKNRTFNFMPWKASEYA